ncbi:MAG: elongation factor P [Planctomycetota bacterium]|nr:MAG: elongation factor P [Planctomycetota bacterium]
MTIKATQIRKGQVLVLDGELYLVTDFEHIAPGNWRAINQVKCKHLTTGTVKQMRLGSDETVELAYLDRRPCVFSYMDGDNYVFMDNENYEQYFLGADVVGEAMKYVKENQTVTLTFHEGKAISIDLPAAVVLQVTEAEMAVKGDSVTNDKKGAVTETGLEIRVPMYIQAGEYVKVSTETGEFLGRAKPEEA